MKNNQINKQLLKMRKAEAATYICENTNLYKVCEGCDSIVLSIAFLCPACKSYRFNANKTYIQKTAKRILKSEPKIYSNGRQY